MLVDVVDIEGSGAARLIDNFLEVLVLAPKRVNIAIDGRQATLEVVDLVVKDLVVSVDGHLAVNQGIHCLGHLVEVTIVELVHLLDECLGCASSHTCIGLRLLLSVHLLLLLVLLLTSNLLVAPGTSRWLLLLLLLARVGWLERNRRASFVHDLLKRVIGSPSAD